MSEEDGRLNAIGELQRRIQRRLAPLLEALAPFQEALGRITEALEGSKLLRLVEAWPRMQERLRSLSEVVRDACRHAALPPFRLMDIVEWQEIERVSKTDGVVAAAALVERLSREALANAKIRQQLICDWRANPLAATRISILEEALRAHELGLYAVSIPPFLAHLEGVIAESRHKSETESGSRDWPQEKRKPGFPKLKGHLAELAEGDELMGKLIRDYVCDTVFQEFFINQDLPPFSRHAILHGFDTRYASEANSVRAILTFDCVQELALDRLMLPMQGE